MLKIAGIVGIGNIGIAICFAIIGDPWWTFLAATVGGNLCGIVTAEAWKADSDEIAAKQQKERQDAR